MSDFSLGNLISKFVNYSPGTATNSPTPASQSFSVPAASPTPAAPQTPSNAPQMGNLGDTGQAVYVKDMMNLPKNINEFVYMVQRNLTQAQLQAQFASAQRSQLSQTQAQILAQLQGLDFQNTEMAADKALLSQLQSTLRNLPISANGLINLNDISAMIQANGKDAIAKLIVSMSDAARSGVTDLSQMKDTAKLINASIAAASQNDSAQTMKLLLLLYLPWLPLQEGVGFDLDIEAGASGEEDDSILTISISTINYGLVVATLILEDSHSVHVNIACAQEFPKDDLTLRIGADEKHYSMQSSIFYQAKTAKSETTEKPQAKVNMSNTNMINPYLLLMAHSIIRHTIEIDREKS